MTAVGVVVIGRNEGARLVRALAAARQACDLVVYADSGSTDGSPQRARELGVRVVELSPARPFCAARGRNEGYDALVEAAPDVRFVQFVDGDCELDRDWIAAARACLEQSEHRALVCGRLRERSADDSIYGRLCDLEFDGPVGRIDRCGGNFMIRRMSFECINGFEAGLVAGEEIDLCARLTEAGFELTRLAHPMAVHDAEMSSFRQWWTREQRCAYGDASLAQQGRRSAVRIGSVWLWTVGWASATILAVVVAGMMFGPVPAAVAAVAGCAALALQVFRIARGVRKRGRSVSDSLLYGAFVLLGKWPHLAGLLKHRRDRRATGRSERLIEYRAGVGGESTTSERQGSEA